jgi:hypothetical protein
MAPYADWADLRSRQSQRLNNWVPAADTAENLTFSSIAAKIIKFTWVLMYYRLIGNIACMFNA